MGLWKQLQELFSHKHRWAVRRGAWPYPDGYGVQCTKCRAIMATGLSEEEALSLRDELREEQA